MNLQIIAGQTVGAVDAILVGSADAHTLYVLAHGAGANLRHAFMERIATELSNVGVATLRYNFPYMQAGGKRPDAPGILEATVRAAIDKGAELANGRKLIAGGKSMGGRMTSQALSKRDDPRVMGIAFLGFPLHQPGKPGIARAEHLASVKQPMLFLQGTRDSLANIEMITDVCASLERAELHIIDGADHSFAVPKRTGRTADDLYGELAGAVADWAAKL